MANEELIESPAKRSWFALHIRTNQEYCVDQVLSQKGYTTYLPELTEYREYGNRRKRFRVPCFRGYLFCNLEWTQRLNVLQTPHVYRIVGRGIIPEPIPESELKAVRTLINSGLSFERCVFPRIGAKITIGRGPLAGLEGVLIDVKGSQRVVVSITLLQRSVSAEIARADLHMERNVTRTLS